MAVTLPRRRLPDLWGQVEQARVPWVAIIGACALTIGIITVKELGGSDTDTDYISMSILIVAFAFVSTLDRRMGLVVAVLAGIIAAIVPGRTSFTHAHIWDAVFRICFLIGMSMSFYRVIVVLREREERLQRQLEHLNLLREEVTILHALTTRTAIDRASVYQRIVGAACRVGAGIASRLLFRDATGDAWDVVAESSALSPGDAGTAARESDHPDAALYEISTGASGCETITIPLSANERVSVALQVDREVARPDTREIAQLLAVFARDATLTLEHVTLQEQLEHLAVLEERGRIARDLHDGLVQSLAGLALHLEYYRDELEPHAATLHAGFDAMSAAINEALNEARSVIQGLRVELSQEDIAGALHNLVDQVQQHGLIVATEIPESPLPLSRTQTQSLYQIAREALHNVVKHAGTSRASLRLVVEPTHIALRITDEGCGFTYPVHGSDPHVAHFGLLGMIERASLLGGEVCIDTSPGAGTTITLAFPYVEEEAYA